MNESVNPIQAYRSWLHGLPWPQRSYLASMFWLCTTENTTDMTLSPEEHLGKLDYYLIREDFPVRVVSRMVTVRAVTDFILRNRQILIGGEIGLPLRSRGDNVLFLSEKQWEKTLTSWRALSGKELSDAAFSAWLQAALEQQNQ